MKVYDSSTNSWGERQTDGSDLERTRSARQKPGDSDVFIKQLTQSLDNSFNLICNLVLEPRADPIPFILIGPTGLWVIQSFSEKGVYKIIEQVWEQLDEESGRYRPVKPNLMADVIEKARHLADFLASHGIYAPPIEAVVFFSNPGAHAEIDHPAARIILMDAINRWINRVLTSQAILKKGSIQMIVDELLGLNRPPEMMEEIKDAYTLQESPAPKTPRTPSRLEEVTREEPRLITSLSKKLPFSSKQWILLGTLVVVNIVILLILVLVVLKITGR